MIKKAMIKITKRMALKLWTLPSVEIYELHSDGAESLIETDTHFNKVRQYGIEGELFGEPYEGDL